MTVGPENTAVRVALWRALHVLHDPPPHVFVDRLGLELAAPAEGWQQRPDMSAFTGPFRASILARARFVEERAASAGQYVILGAGLDTFAWRHRELKVEVFEIDQLGPQEWKRQRLAALGWGLPSNVHLVPVNFEQTDDWVSAAVGQGFAPGRPSVIASTGVSMYLTREAIASTLRQIAGLAKGTTLIMSFMLPIELAEPEVRPGIEAAARGAKAAGTPFISFFTPEQMLALARECGFATVEHVSAEQLAERYFAGRSDGLRPPKNSEELLIATV